LDGGDVQTQARIVGTLTNLDEHEAEQIKAMYEESGRLLSSLARLR